MNRTLSYIAVAIVLLTPLAAIAQVVGADPATGLNALVNEIGGPLARPIITLGFMIVGLVMIAGRHTWEGLIFCILGATFFVGSGGLAGMMTGGG